jgi:ADP-ribose pyrophosphatase YjhB (NUDIX family)
MGRIDYWQDPDAPSANSLVVTASAIVTDWTGRIVLHRRVDNGLWALPGGQVELGESVRAGAVREVLEETGLEVRAEYVVGVYSDPDHVMAYDDGEVRQEFSVCLKCRLIGGTLTASRESHEVRWVRPDEADQMAMHPRIQNRINDFLTGPRGRLDP